MQASVFTKDDFKHIFESSAAAITQSTQLLYLAAFYLVVKPIADRYDWEISWGMGNVTFMNKNREDVSECKTVENLEKKLKDMFIDVGLQYLSHHQGELLDTLEVSFPKHSCYHKSYGLRDADGRIRKFNWELREAGL